MINHSFQEFLRLIYALVIIYLEMQSRWRPRGNTEKMDQKYEIDQLNHSADNQFNLMAIQRQFLLLVFDQTRQLKPTNKETNQSSLGTHTSKETEMRLTEEEFT